MVTLERMTACLICLYFDWRIYLIFFVMTEWVYKSSNSPRYRYLVNDRVQSQAAPLKSELIIKCITTGNVTST
jgi:hypothetical protein